MAIQPTLFDTTGSNATARRQIVDPTSLATAETRVDQGCGRAVSNNPAAAADRVDSGCDSASVEADSIKDLSAKDLAARLWAQIGGQSSTARKTSATFTSGSPQLDQWLPRGGLRVDGISEWVAEPGGSGAASLAMIAAAARLRRSNGPLVVVAGEGTFYPPAALSLGVAPQRIIWVRPSRRADLVWAIDQALRCDAVAAVWAHIGPDLDSRDARRFQLAAETGNTPGLFIRPASVRGRPSFTDVRFYVRGREAENRFAETDIPLTSETHLSVNRRSRLLHITLERCRGGVAGQTAWIEIDDQARIRELAANVPTSVLPTSRTLDPGINHETAALHLASELAHPKKASSPKKASVSHEARRRA